MLKKILVIVVLLVASCKSYDLKGKKYTSSNGEKQVVIEFVNDTLSKVTQEYFCNDLPEKYAQTEIMAKYSVEKYKVKGYSENYKPKTVKTTILVLENIKCDEDCEKYIEIPNYESLDCSQIKIDHRLKDKIVLGRIYNLAKDTFELKNNEILFGYLKLKQEE